MSPITQSGLPSAPMNMQIPDRSLERLRQLLDDAQAELDEVRRQQRETGGFERAHHVRLAGRAEKAHGYLAALIDLGVQMPIEVQERVSQLGEDVRSMLYRDRRPRET
jgi:hypothetical protein